MQRMVAVVTLLFALAIMALAHGNEKHVMGKVTSISDSSITVETTAKKSVTVDVSDQTKFEKSGFTCHPEGSKGWRQGCNPRRCLGHQARRKRSPVWGHEGEVHGMEGMDHK